MGKQNLKIIEFLNCSHSAIKFIVNYSQKEIIFYMFSSEKITNVSLINISDQQTRINIYMFAYVTYNNRKNPYLTVSQALRLNNICSENSSYDHGCNDFEVWLTGVQWQTG